MLLTMSHRTLFPSISLSQRQPKKAFTLTELLVVVAVIGILAGLAITAIGQTRDSAARTECLQRLQQLGLAISTYSSDNDNRFPGYGVNSRSRWVHQVGPYLGYEADYVKDGFDLSHGAYEFEEFHCPAQDLWRNPVPAANQGLYGINPNLLRDADAPPNTSIVGIPRSRVMRPSSTVLLADKFSSDPFVNTIAGYPDQPKGASANHRADRSPANGPDGNAHYLFCDGHVEAYQEWIGSQAFELN